MIPLRPELIEFAWSPWAVCSCSKALRRDLRDMNAWRLLAAGAEHRHGRSTSGSRKKTPTSNCKEPSTRWTSNTDGAVIEATTLLTSSALFVSPFTVVQTNL